LSPKLAGNGEQVPAIYRVGQ